MARLPIPGSDEVWGEILNEYLLQAHTADGALKAGTVGASQIQDGAVGGSKVGKGSMTIQASDGSTHALQVVSSDRNAVYLKVTPTQVTSGVPLIAPNLPRKIVAQATEPQNPQDGDIWFDTSAAKTQAS